MTIAARRNLLATLGAMAGMAAFAGAAKAQGAAAGKREFLKSDAAQKNAYSQAVITQGGRTVWLAGQTASPALATNKALAADFDGQVRAAFDAMSKTLERAGGKLSDIVSMTVFMVDDRHDRRFLELRQEIMGDNFPASALINVRSLALPEAMLEIQAVAVIV
jgi:enamine deaminase RidA (YjgF/YER057c/UK114 family)